MSSIALATSRRTGRFPLYARVGLLSLALLLAACKGGAKDGKEPGGDADKKGPEAIPVEVAKAGRRAISASYNGTAALTPVAEAEVAAKTSGIAMRVRADVGDQVRAGQPLLQIDRDRATLQVAQVEAQVRKLEANYRRAAQLASQQMVSANDVDQLRFDLENARAQHRLAKLELSYGTVVAPISGVVAARMIKPGNFVQINSTVFKLVDNSRLEAKLNVPERDIELLRAGQPVVLEVDALPGKAFEGSISRIAPMIDPGSGTFQVISTFDGGGLLQAGMFGRVRIHYDQRPNALVIPRSALLEDGGTPAAYVVRGGKATRAPLQLGFTEGEWVEVRDGLGEGDAVVVAGKAALREGSAVQVIDAVAAPAAKPAAGAKPADPQAGR